MSIEKFDTGSTEEFQSYQYDHNWERVALPSYENYSDFLETQDLLDGRYPVDDYHAFYIWLSRDPKFQDIDGYAVIDIYEKNVIEEGNMTQERFLEWCRDFNIPVPIEAHGEVSPQGELFNEWFEKEVARRETEYTIWANKNHIDISKGAVMRFIDKDAHAHYIATSTEDAGTIVG
jgi:hypothetical protein